MREKADIHKEGGGLGSVDRASEKEWNVEGSFGPSPEGRACIDRYYRLFLV